MRLHCCFGGNRRTDVFCGGVKAWCHVEKELLGIPGGSMIVKFAVKLHLLKN